MGETVKLNVINRTTDIEQAHLVICQHNAAAGLRANPVAWQVLHMIPRQGSYVLDVPVAFDVGVKDAAGHDTAPVPADVGQAFELVKNEKTAALFRANLPSADAKTVEVRNTERDGPVSALVFKSGRLLARKTKVEIGQTAAFQFHPHIYIGVSGQIEEGSEISLAASSLITTRVNLEGIHAADLVMSNGTEGALLPRFELENIE